LCKVGFSDGAIPDDSWLGDYPNSYAISIGYDYYGILAGRMHLFQLPEEAIQPRQVRGIKSMAVALCWILKTNWHFFYFEWPAHE
jgi:hypothetical protein